MKLDSTQRVHAARPEVGRFPYFSPHGNRVDRAPERLTTRGTVRSRDVARSTQQMMTNLTRWLLAPLLVSLLSAGSVRADDSSALPEKERASWHLDANAELGGGRSGRVRARGGVVHLLGDSMTFVHWEAGATVALDTSRGFGGGVQLAAGIGPMFLITGGIEHWTNGASTTSVGLGTIILLVEWEHRIEGPVPNNSFFVLINVPVGLLLGARSEARSAQGVEQSQR